jgi:hypothetical protein
MELQLDHLSWQDASRDSRIGGGVASKLDWQSLAMRLAAAHAFARSLDQEAPLRALPAGSFDPAAARHIATRANAAPSHGLAATACHSAPAQNGYLAVNPVVLGDSKSMSGKDTTVAGSTLPAIED